MVFGIKSQINKRSHTTLSVRVLSPSPTPGPSKCSELTSSVYSVYSQDITSPANHQTITLAIHEAPSPESLDTHSRHKTSKKQTICFLSDPPCISQQSSWIAIRLRVPGMNIECWKLRLFTWTLTIELGSNQGPRSQFECLNGLSVVTSLQSVVHLFFLML